MTETVIADLRPAAAPDPPLRRIAFGSCASQARPQPIWDAVAATRPELLLMLGDNIYADTEDMDVMRAKYARLAAMPGFKALRGTPTLLGRSPEASDPQLARRLWEAVAQLTGAALS